jgi:HEAT repeat protein
MTLKRTVVPILPAVGSERSKPISNPENLGSAMSNAEQITLLSGQLASDEAMERAAAAEQLARMGPEAQPAVRALLRATEDWDEPVRDWAVAALEGLGPPQLEDREALAALVAHPKTNIAYWSATLLGRLGESAAPAVQALGSAVANHPVMAVRQRSAWALGQIGPAARPALESLQSAAASDDPRLARLATRAIEQIGD